jgi:lipopolysaccharide export system permease protein
MKLLDRYVLRSFMEPFLICSGGFIAIWLMFDYSDKSNDFIQVRASFKQIAGYYLTQLPALLLLSLPIGLLLALLYSLSAMSRRNEIISMISAGRSVARVLLPLIGVGVLLSGLCLWLNWEYAPHAAGIQKTAIKQMKPGKEGEKSILTGHVFRNRAEDRTWYVQKLRPGSANLSGVHITQQTPDGAITRKYYARRAIFHPEDRSWELVDGMIANFTPAGDIGTTDYFPKGERFLTDWSETPWRIASSQLDPAGLSVPELRGYLRHNSDFPAVQLAPYRAHLADRYAQPLFCLVAVLIAAPLGVVFSRRGILGSLFAALLIFVALIPAHDLLLAFGKGDRLPPFLAPWLPQIAGVVIGLVLLWFRSTSRDAASLFRKNVAAPTPIAG